MGFRRTRRKRFMIFFMSRTGEKLYTAPAMERVARQSMYLYVPNLLTYGRIVAVPALVGCFFIKDDFGNWLSLAIFVGALGIHRFYLGFTTLGIVMVCITVLSLFILAPFVAIWGLIDGILIFTGSIDKDAEGVPLV